MIVTRFAPSPTGYLHVGGARTALFNWLLARKTGGKFILRIEDTDIKRNTPTATQQVIDDLKWLGIDWDEGPEVDGPNGPYFQSQRLETYKKYIQQLLDAGMAYYCFDTPEELTAMRDKAAKEKRNFSYPRPEKFPTMEDVEQAKAEGRPVVVRFCMPDEDIVISDVIRGEVRFAPADMSDFIIQKSDGYPTYHFAVVVDDELMEVTHVMRGQEHLMNTPYHQALQKELGFRTPTYAHMSVTVSEGGGKLSKRERPKALRTAIKSKQDVDLEELAAAGGITVEELESFLKKKTTPDMPAINSMADALGVHLPEINVVDFFNSGYLPETLVNFLGLLGWSPGDDREIMPVSEQIECFDIKRLTKSNSLFDRKKLQSFNTEHIRMIDKDRLLEHFRAFLQAQDSPLLKASDEVLKRVLHATEGSRTLAEIEKKSKFIVLPNDEIEYDPKSVKKVLLKKDGLRMLGLVRERMAGLEEVTAENIETALRSLAEEQEVGLGKVAQPLRVALCGTTVSLPIFDSVDLLGMDNTLERIDLTLEKFKNE
ncbi:Glutamate--tRNA ligase [Anaerohalosphaera lusitana]|uniref:Glutamate--tRNA ligase n=1 Tax=Anaerohalosphaera lusitana TaxID=1936003 RepID=A0A1U9NKL9_9BACT|nr:glutamate--tRNA ligase [Anaerohalosphaera lusitana]AQT68355.1 Glutamate--tRNA ligase [Anaerohalosphaera lusitana]